MEYFGLRNLEARWVKSIKLNWQNQKQTLILGMNYQNGLMQKSILINRMHP